MKLLSLKICGLNGSLEPGGLSCLAECNKNMLISVSRDVGLITLDYAN